MPLSAGAVVELTNVEKDYRGLRPLRIERLAIGAAEPTAIVGFDAVTAEVFVNLVTGTTLPDRGEIRLFGRSTAAIDGAADWLAVVDRFGIVSARAVFLDALSVIQNLSMPFTLDIEPPPGDIQARASALAREVGLPEAVWGRPAGDLDPVGRARLRWGRALALDPAILLLEHSSADLPRNAVVPLGRRIRAVAERRGAAVLAATADEVFAAAVATRVLRLDPATGRLAERRGWFRRS